MASTDGAEAPANAVSEEDTAQPPAEASPHSSNGDARPADCGVGAAEARRIQVREPKRARPEEMTLCLNLQCKSTVGSKWQVARLFSRFVMRG